MARPLTDSFTQNVEQIKDVNRTLLKNIEECMKASPNLEDVLLGETFIRLVRHAHTRAHARPTTKLPTSLTLPC